MVIFAFSLGAPEPPGYTRAHKPHPGELGCAELRG